jgi:formylglycine-generating enzyme required for sulfatase activity
MQIDLAPGCSMSFALIPAGDFVLGGSPTYADERPLGTVTIDRPFWLGKFEVTNQQFQCYDSNHESGVEPMLWLKWSREDYASLKRARQPVCRVSWNEARAFCQWLSRRTGKAFALPSEAQWEWACRAGTDKPLHFGASDASSASFANLADASLQNFTQWPRTTPFSRLELVRQFYAVDPVDDEQRVSAEVGSYLPNRWGLYDLHGNVGEWTSSAYVPYPFRSEDPRHADPEARRVARGGSWFDRADLARSGCRTSYWPWQQVFDVGFRVMCEMESGGN